MSDTTLLERASAEKALAALTGEDTIHGEALKSALANVLARKLGRTAPPLPESERMPDKFERFFDMLFDVEFERKALPVARVIEIAEEVVAGLREDAAEALKDGEDDMKAMYDEDASDYEKMIVLLREGKTRDAVKAWGHFDTASRGRLFGRTPQEEHEFAIFLMESGE